MAENKKKNGKLSENTKEPESLADACGKCVQTIFEYLPTDRKGGNASTEGILAVLPNYLQVGLRIYELVDREFSSYMQDADEEDQKTMDELERILSEVGQKKENGNLSEEDALVLLSREVEVVMKMDELRKRKEERKAHRLNAIVTVLSCVIVGIGFITGVNLRTGAGVSAPVSKAA